MTTDPHDATDAPEECLERAIEIVAQYTHTHDDAVTRFYHHRRELRNPENLVIAQIVDQVILRLKAEKRAADAEAQVKALSRPVSDEEAQKYADYMDCEGWYHRFRFTPEQVTALIAARLSGAKGETKP